MRQAAIQNNFDWCRLICELNGCTVTETHDSWKATGNVPPLYPEMMVRSHQQQLDLSGITSVKDCTASYDFSRAGLTHLFTAEWITRRPILDRRALPVDWTVVTDLKESTRFFNIIDTDDVPKTLFERSDVRLFFSEPQQAGFIAYSNRQTTGLSHLTSNYLDERLWDDVIRLSSAHFPGQPLVGYEYGDQLITALEAGFDDIGPLAVWIRSI
ncbi:hypothetical protein [Exiguobacterium antarcticum]|uniref:Uncharacterized protein n=1 Tax=Exiguobacterium antarcticum TaxID=132920 RepID=A0ABT6R0C2_9BACL|nr:hypothetical protein [Exiguobacterium antarcticum]AFS71644.1 Hypothetical protein Eab7_2555 [Exiguobacterium antarcticum B7]MDI3234382.1 hypothetical protein [Exiguobacterium antarcticum]